MHETTFYVAKNGTFSGGIFQVSAEIWLYAIKKKLFYAKLQIEKAH